jgi:Arc/MetJ-type ribon-helix-helix transcriptional regulator
LRKKVAMPSITVELTEPLARFAEEAVARGDYPSASAALQDALYVLRQDPAVHGETMAVLRREVRRGAIEADAGLFSPYTIEEIAAQVAAEDDQAA